MVERAEAILFGDFKQVRICFQQLILVTVYFELILVAVENIGVRFQIQDVFGFHITSAGRHNRNIDVWKHERFNFFVVLVVAIVRGGINGQNECKKDCDGLHFRSLMDFNGFLEETFLDVTHRTE